MLREVGDVGGRFGVFVAERLLGSDDLAERLRGVRRLSALGTAQAIDALVRSQEPGSSASRSIEVRLEAARGLARFADRDTVRQVLLRALVEGGGEKEPALGAVLRDTAALALARGGDEQAIDALLGLARQGGLAGASATRALAAHPPARIASLLDAKAPLALPTVELIAQLGDLRGLAYLRRAVREGEADVRARSLEVMAELGDGEAAEIARDWASVEEPMARLAAARALTISAPAEGRKLIAQMLRDARVRAFAIALAERAAGPALSEALAEALRSSTEPGEQASLIVALGRSGGAPAAQALAALLTGERSHFAAQALGQAPGREAREAIEAALRDPARRVQALRAAAVRASVLHDTPRGLSEAAKEAFALGGVAQEAAVFAWVLTGERDPDDSAFASRPALTAAAARAALARPRQLGALIGALDAKGSDEAWRDALGLALVAQADGGSIPSATLLAWAEEGSAIAPLAARALAMRDDASYRSRLSALLSSTDPRLRAHVALGLAASPEPSAAGRLVDAYGFEPEAVVRRVIVRALARRSEPVREATLAQAAALDPDRAARSLAHAALTGRALPTLAQGEMVGWLHVVAEDSAAQVALSWERPDGLALVVVPDADGGLLVAGLPSGPSHVTVPLRQAPSGPAAPSAASSAAPPASSESAAPPSQAPQSSP